jgi:fucose permease
LDRNQTTLGLIGYFFIGTAAVLLPSVMPSITAEFAATGLTLAAIGLIFPAASVGGILGNLLAGAGSDVIGRRWLVWLSALILAASLALAAIAQLWFFFIIGYVVVSAAQASLSTGINAMIADANRDARARALNVLHGVYGVGAAVSPLIIGALIERGLPWRWAVGGAGLIWLTYGLVAYRSYRSAPSSEKRSAARKLDLGMLRKRPFFALFLIAFIYNGVAVSLLGWIAVFVRQSAGVSIFFSVSLISVFYVGLTIGRFICAAVAERFKYAAILLALAIGVAITYPLVVLGVDSLLVVAAVFLTGLSLSGLFPTALAFGSRLYPEQAGTLSGTLSVALTFGSMLPPLWTGTIAAMWGFQAALGVNYVMVLPLLFLALYLGRIEIRRLDARTVVSTAQ